MSSLPLHNKEGSVMVQGSRPRRGLLVYLALLVALSWTAYTYFPRKGENQTIMADDEHTWTSSDAAQQDILDVQPESKDMIQLLDLSLDHLPQTGKHRHPRRLVVVGDVHGMKHSLLELLEKVNFDEKHDHLILAGDMISKGPDSRGVVDLAMKLGATGIRGNHEDRILRAHAHMMAENFPTDLLEEGEDMEEAPNVPEEIGSSNSDHKDRKLVKALGKRRIKWLKKCPVILRVGKLGSLGEVVVVHAGLAPGVKLEKQDPALVMNMRTTAKGGVPSEEREGQVWTRARTYLPLDLRTKMLIQWSKQAWNKYQKGLHKKERTTVIYGHDSKRGLNIEAYSMGIDTGCLKGGKLTAVVIEGGHSDHTSKVIHVNCKDGRAK